MQKKLAPLWASAAAWIALTASSSAQDVEMPVHYVDKHETKVILPVEKEEQERVSKLLAQGKEGEGEEAKPRRIRMKVEADYWGTIALFAQLDSKFYNYMSVPPQERLQETHPDLIRKAQAKRPLFAEQLKKYMQNLSPEQQENIIHVFSILIVLDEKKPQERQDFTAEKFLRAYERDALREGGILMQASNLVINDRFNQDPRNIALIKYHGASHHSKEIPPGKTLSPYQKYYILTDEIEAESRRVLEEGPHYYASGALVATPM